MKLEQLRLHVVKMDLKAPFRTSFGVEYDRRFILVEAHCEGVVGLAECVAMDDPIYNEEFLVGALHVIEHNLAPVLLGQDLAHPKEVGERLAFIRGNKMAISAIEGALWDAYAKTEGVPLWKALGGDGQPIEVGVSIGIQDTPEQLVELVRGYVAAGYRRIKLKIEPGSDVQFVGAVRRAFPETPIMADANSAYRLEDAEHLAQLDEFNLMMIEQPLNHDDMLDHAKLQKRLRTPICLDESIHSPEHARKAIEIGACGVINIKIGRVGGLQASIELQDICRRAGIPVWCGGMQESGIGRAHNIAVTTLPGFTLPGDTSGSDRYWEEDIIDPEVRVSPEGTITPPTSPGIGFEPKWDLIRRLTEKTVEVR